MNTITDAAAAVTSRDGTTIGYRQLGHGPGVVVVHGANESSRSHLQLAEALADSFTIYLPDRRGRGLSGPFGDHYSMQKEVEDLEALLSKTGAQYVFGASAGGLICLQAALTLPTIRKATLYEPALLPKGSKRTVWLPRYDREMAEGKVAAALVTSMKGLRLGPPIFVAMPRRLLAALTNMAMQDEDKKAKPGDITMRMLAPTLHYDGELLGEMAGKLEQFRTVQADVLLLGGTKGLPYLKGSRDALEQVLPHVQRIELHGLDHGGSSDPSNTNRGSGVQPQRVAQAVRRFFAEP
jgi:pimeloyl-ACP methyl ester carboxylesterase